MHQRLGALLSVAFLLAVTPVAAAQQSQTQPPKSNPPADAGRSGGGVGADKGGKKDEGKRPAAQPSGRRDRPDQPRSTGEPELRRRKPH